MGGVPLQYAYITYKAGNAYTNLYVIVIELLQVSNIVHVLYVYVRMCMYVNCSLSETRSFNNFEYKYSKIHTVLKEFSVCVAKYTYVYTYVFHV